MTASKLKPLIAFRGKAWIRCTLRARPLDPERLCTACRKPLLSGDVAYRQLHNGMDRSDRLCGACGETCQVRALS